MGVGGDISPTRVVLLAGGVSALPRAWSFSHARSSSGACNDAFSHTLQPRCLALVMPLHLGCKSRRYRTPRAGRVAPSSRGDVGAKTSCTCTTCTSRGDVVTFFDYTLTELGNLRIFSCERRRICQYPMTPVTHGGRRFGKLKTFWVTRHWNFLCDTQTDRQAYL